MNCLRGLWRDPHPFFPKSTPTPTKTAYIRFSLVLPFCLPTPTPTPPPGPAACGLGPDQPPHPPYPDPTLYRRFSPPYPRVYVRPLPRLVLGWPNSA